MRTSNWPFSMDTTRCTSSGSGAPGRWRSLTRPGRRLPLHATGVGKVLLAYATPEFVDQVVARGLPEMTPHTITDGDTLRKCLVEVRERGYATTRDEMTMGAVSVGAAILAPDERVVGAVSLVVASRGADARSLAIAVRAVASGITRRVGEASRSGTGYRW